jgi:hypothetical protein
MVALFIILIVLALILGGFGLAVGALKFLLYIAIILLIVGVIGWIIRGIRGRA